MSFTPTMTELEQYIHQHFAMSVEDCEKVSSLFYTETLKKGDYFLRSGTHCNKLSFIRDGILRVYVTLPNAEVTQWIATRGYFMTDLNSFFYGQPGRFNMQALTDTPLYTIDADQYARLGKLVPRWNDFEKLFMGRCFVTLENRVFDLIALPAEARYQKLFEQNRDLFNQVPLQYLASMLGMTPETLSRIRRKALS
ncbi:Crp/Fnr family transcriptional regulator [Mucilaginibacter sp. CSA2-8R]|uniref:Crp/Fnr family transcriptional regulator n=1 Tax=Mucilaginibacter sp. CSA2-8R TaxID=3141542 RepID=UPI00315D5167